MHSLIFSQTLSAERLTRNKERPPQRSENAASTESSAPLRILFGIALILLISPSALVVRADVLLATNGTAHCVVVAPERVVNAPSVKRTGGVWLDRRPEVQLERLRNSVRDLAHYLGILSGTSVEVVTEIPADKRIPILVAESAEARFGKPEGKSHYAQGFRYVVASDAVGLAGDSDLATSYAVYELLHRLGCRWFIPSSMGEVIPTTPTIRLAETDEQLAPYTHFRGIWFADDDYARRNRLGGLNIEAGHALEGYISKEQRDEHPEWQAVSKGKPSGRRLKWSKPGVAEAIAASVITYLETYPDTRSVSLSPDDGLGYDDTDDRSLDAGDFDPTLQDISISDRQVWLCNKVIDRVTPKYPDMLFGMLAYAQSTRPPLRETPHPSLVPVLAPITYRRAHPMTWDGVPGNAELRQAIEGWAAKSTMMAYYFYGWFLAEPSAPSPFITKWKEDLNFIYAKGNCRFWQPETLATFDSNLYGLYMGIRMAWDPTQDPDDIIQEIHHSFYGHAGNAMGHYWNFVDQVWTSTEEYSGCGFGHLRRWRPGNMGLARHLMDRALRSVRAREEIFRVQLANDNLALFELFMQMRQDLSQGRFAKLGQSAEHYYTRAQQLAHNYKDQFAFGGASYLSASDKTWYAKYFKSFYMETYKDAARLAADFEILTHPPMREWRYRADPDRKGAVETWSQEDLDDSEWKTTDTCIDTWSTLGYHDYMGVMWYRATTDIPALPAGKRLHLWIGATDGSAKVYVNGTHVPYRDGDKSQDAFSGYCKPASFDITDAARPGARNQITVECERTFINELGTGGILGSPVVLYRDK